jgi:iron-sulfur cluster repair protein YtfE (RIC family)
MDLIDALLGEHGVFAALFESLDQLALRGPPPAELSTALITTAAALVTHARLEEELLFPAIERAHGRIPPLMVMTEQHREIEDMIERVRHAAHADTASRALLLLLQATRAHFTTEEEVLFPMARELVDDATLARLGGEWAALRGVAVPAASALSEARHG